MLTKDIRELANPHKEGYLNFEYLKANLVATKNKLNQIKREILFSFTKIESITNEEMLDLITFSSHFQTNELMLHFNTSNEVVELPSIRMKIEEFPEFVKKHNIQLSNKNF